MANNLAVKITADVVELQTKFAVARAEVSNLTSEMNKLAKQSAAGIIDSAGQAKLQELAGDLVRARQEAAALGVELREATHTTQGVGTALEELHEKLSTALQVSGIAAAVEGFNLLREAVLHVTEQAKEISVGAETLGVTVEQFQAMQHAAEEAGVGADTLTHAAERMETALNQARNGSSSAIDKLLQLGITTKQISDPTFTIIDLLGTVKERLLDSNSAEEERNALLQEFGTRSATAIAALREFEGGESGVRRSMEETNGLSDEQIKRLKEMGSWWGSLWKTVENTSAKVAVAVGNMTRTMSDHQSIDDELFNSSSGQQAKAADMGPTVEAATEASKSRVQIARDEAHEWDMIQQEMHAQELRNTKAGVEAYKEGSTERLEALRSYAQSAADLYGKDSTIAEQAQEKVIEETRRVSEQQQRDSQQAFEKQIELERRIVSERMSAISKQIEQSDRYLDEESRDEQELFGGWEKTYAEITNKHATMIEKQISDGRKSAQEQVKVWQGMVGEIESAEASLVSGLVNRRKTLSQNLLQIGSELVTREIANDLKAFTTKELLHDSDRALEQGGLLFHMQAEAQKVAATHASESAQTSATVAGNAARTASTDAAQASSAATAAAVGGKTVMQDAAKAFTGTYAAVAQIPYVGWILAPAAASAAFATVAAYEGLASLDVGTNYVPRDMVAQIHEGEAVVPKAFNPFARGGGFALAGAGASGFSEEHNYHGDVNVSAFDASSVARMLRRPGMRNSVVDSAVRAFRRGAR